MTALKVRRQDGRRRLHRTLAWPAWVLIGGCGLALADPVPVSNGPGTPPAAADPAPDLTHPDDRLPDRPAESPPPPDAAPPDRPPRDRPPLTTPAAAPADAADRPASPAGPQAASTESIADSPLLTEAEFRSRRSLNHVLYRDRRYRLLLDQARTALAAGDQLAAFDHLLELTTAAEDVFVWDEAAGRPRSARLAGRDILQQLSPAHRDQFDRYVGGAAQRELDAAIVDQSLSRLQATARSYPSTAAGRQALRMTAVQLFDCGRLSAAAEAWRQLIAAQGASSLADQDRLRAAFAARADDDQELLQLLLDYSSAPITVGTSTHSLTTWLELQPSPASRETARSETLPAHWQLPQGDVTGQRHAAGTPPYHIPVWSAAVVDSEAGESTTESNPETLTLSPRGDWRIEDEFGITAWAASCVDRDEIPASAAAPIVIGDALISRESSSLVARQLATGQILWRHPCETDLSGLPSKDATSFCQASAENALLQSLSTDGQRVYFIDALAELSTPGSSVAALESDASGSTPSPGLVNRLMAIAPAVDADPARGGAPAVPRIAWSVGGNPASTSDAHPLAGHFFLGVPIPVDDLLLVVSECRGQVNLIGLHAATGELRFQQGLALVDRPLTFDSDRLRLCLIPACRDDLVVVPTPCGAVVAFDLSQRSLCWTSQYRNLDTAVSTSWRGDGRDQATLYPVQPVFADERVLILPADSVELLAFDIEDGRSAWSLPRRGGAQITVSNHGQVVLSSTDHVFCLDVETGDLCWEARVGPLAGRGLLLGEHFLIPRCDGRVLALDLQTGQPPLGGPEILAVTAAELDATTPLLSTAIDSTAPTPRRDKVGGNLVACGDCLVVAAPQRTAVYLQSRALRNLLTSSIDRSTDWQAPLWSEIGVNWVAAEQQQHLAELALTLGDADEARLRLAELVAADRSAVTPRPDAARVRRLLRELLHLRLEADNGRDSAETLAQLRELIETNGDAARWRVAVLRDAATRGDVAAWVDAAQQLAAVDAGQLVPLDVARRHQVHPATVMAESRSLLLHQARTDEVERLAVAAQERWRIIQPSDDVAALSRFVRVFGAGTAADRARRQLARLCDQSGQRLAAESWLLDIEAESGSSFEASVQRQLLALERRRQRPARTHILQTQGVREFSPLPRVARINTLAANAPAKQLAMAGEAIPFGVDTRWLRGDELRAELHVMPIDDDFPLTLPDLALLSDAGREWCRDPDSALRILNLGDPRLTTTSNSDRTPAATISSPPQIELALMQRDSADVHARIILPARCSEPALLSQSSSGHFLATAADGELHGLSLLDGARLWTAHVVGGERSERLHPGPSGPGYCIAQLAGGVCNVDPVTGRLLWQRRDVSVGSGLFAKEDSGLFGDEHCLVVVDGDQRSCQVLETSTGRTLRTDVIPTTDLRRTRFPFGSRLFFVTGGDEDPRFRLWDAASGRLLLDDPADYPFRHARIDRDHVYYLSAARQLVIFNARLGEPVLRRTLSVEDMHSLTSVDVYRDADCWYIQTSHAGTAPSGSRCEPVTSDVKVPCQTMSGRVSAYSVTQPDRALWTHDFDNRTLLVERRRSLPFLVTLHRSRDEMAGTTRSVTVEILDRQSGHVVAQSTDLDQPRILHCSHDGPRRQYSLYTETSLLTMQYELPEKPSIYTAEK